MAVDGATLCALGGLSAVGARILLLTMRAMLKRVFREAFVGVSWAWVRQYPSLQVHWALV